ncbi:16 kDa calcium-binding protein-like [Tubulanus polymorphus]|uniref:16 kDa calcium-binding protein-like n=1 Tax=Tubulanus polymorphus TaxID=672921 RepID=UPI003DA4A5C0
MADSNTLLDMFKEVCKKYQITDVSDDLGKAFRTFVHLDKDRDGTLDKEEIKKMDGMSEKMIEILFKTADGGTTDTITLQKLFKFFFLPRIKKNWKTLFDLVDTDNSGHITVDEIEPYLAACGVVGADSEDAINIISSYDTDNDQQLSYEEFSKYLIDDLDKFMDELVSAHTKK